ncbi:wlm domain containing protein [Moniliophthora roreri MCA 2997]|uniref:Wlm domain containing protein n=1 Tax=Moniliophthora roreri (strain MCA 2997) TaxID=1381753 RepID=V2XG79_MONRO|nr:wlm domain containing protein [Moniliophthora roreri MCA 2997]
MVHVRLNETETNPNSHINFITALPAYNAEDQENARQFLRALAAQVRPLMKAHGFVINSLEEYEYNSVFAGRNWNNGETVELVLRRPGGSFLPTSWLMSTLCHELAHIKHMNHGPAFQALWRRLRTEVRELQNKGYYGDGYWSSGKRLADSATVSGEGIDDGEFPEYMCGGAQSRSRPFQKGTRRGGPRRPKQIIPSNHTGRQTEKKRKPGSRVTSKYAFEGQGIALNDGDTSGTGTGTGKGKRAASKRAREERALAAERRMQMLQAQQAGPSPKTEAPDQDDSDDDEIDFIETDADRRKALLDSESDPDKPGVSWRDFDDDFIFTGEGKTGVIPAHDDDMGKRKADDEGTDTRPAKISKLDRSQPRGKSLGLVKDEIHTRKQESLGMEPGRQYKLSSKPKPKSTPIEDNHKQVRSRWSCLVCTLENESDHLACSACATPKGEETWSGQG